MKQTAGTSMIVDKKLKLYRCEPLSAAITREQCERNRSRGGGKFSSDLTIFACQTCGGLSRDRVKIQLETSTMAKKQCDVPGCERITHSRGKCWKHVKEVLGLDPATGAPLVTEEAPPLNEALEEAVATGEQMADALAELASGDEESGGLRDDLKTVVADALVAADDPLLNAENDVDFTVSAFVELGMKIGALVERKQAAYGDSFGKSGDVMRILYPAGIRPDQYDDALGVIRVVDKLFRVATDRDALGESPWKDITGYGLLGALRVEGESCTPSK